MATNHSVPLKNTGDQLTAAEFNDLANTVSAHASEIDQAADKPTFSTTVSTGVDITPDFDVNQDFVLLFDATSTGDINFQNSSTTNLEHGEKVRVVLTNGDAVDRNLVFGSTYVNTDDSAVGTVELASAAGEYRVLEFVRTGSANVTLISDTGATTDAQGVFLGNPSTPSLFFPADPSASNLPNVRSDFSPNDRITVSLTDSSASNVCTVTNPLSDITKGSAFQIEILTGTTPHASGDYQLSFGDHWFDQSGQPLGVMTFPAGTADVLTFQAVNLLAGNDVYNGFAVDNSSATVCRVVSHSVAVSAEATLIDSSGGVVTETLPAASGSGSVLFYANADVTNNTATLAVQPGESLRGVTDGTFLFSNYADGTQFRVDDVAAGEWVVSVVGEATQNTKPYARLEVTKTTAEAAGYSGGEIEVQVPAGTNTLTVLPFTKSKLSSSMSADLVDSTTYVENTVYDPTSYTLSGVTVPETGLYRIKSKNPDALDASVEAADQPIYPIAVNGVVVELDPSGYNSEDPKRSNFEAHSYNDITLQLNAGDIIHLCASQEDTVNGGGANEGESFDIKYTIADNTFGAEEAAYWLEVERVDSSEVVLAGMVTPEDLAKFSVSKTGAAQAIPTTTYPAQELVTWTDVETDTDSGFAANQYTVPVGHGGFWRLNLAIETAQAGTMDGMSSLQIVVNGAEVARSGFATSGDNVGGAGSNDINYGNVSKELTLNEGDVVEAYVTMPQGIGLTANATTTYFEGSQQTTKSVVMPDAVPVEDLAISNHAWSGIVEGTSGVAQAFPAAASSYDPDSMFNGTDTWTIPQDGLYSVRFLAGESGATSQYSSYEIRINGVTAVALTESSTAGGGGQDYRDCPESCCWRHRDSSLPGCYRVACWFIQSCPHDCSACRQDCHFPEPCSSPRRKRLLQGIFLAWIVQRQHSEIFSVHQLWDLLSANPYSLDGVDAH